MPREENKNKNSRTKDTRRELLELRQQERPPRRQRPKEEKSTTLFPMVSKNHSERLTRLGTEKKQLARMSLKTKKKMTNERI